MPAPRTALGASCLALIVHKDRIGVTERREEFEQIGFGIDLGLFKNAIFKRSFEDLLLSHLTHLCFKAGVWLVQYPRLAVIHIGFFVIKRGDQDLSWRKLYGQHSVLEVHIF